MILHEVDIDTVSEDGDGVATLGRRRVLVPFTLPGERVRVAAIRTSDTIIEARLVEVLRASPHRVQPRCKHAGPGDGHSDVCGGCSWQHIAYPEQLRLKTAILDRLVRAHVPEAPASAPTQPATPLDTPWEFRQKVHFVFGSGGQGRRQHLLMGHYARGSRRVVPVDECPVHDSRGNAVAFALYREFARAGAQAATTHGKGSLRSVAVRVARHTDESLVTLVVADDADRTARSATRKAMAAAPPSTAFHLNVHPRDDGFVFGPSTRRLSGHERLRERVRDTAFLVSPTAFFQTNVAAAELLVDAVLRAMPAPPARVLDLYAGAGLFAIPLARAGHRVTAVEENRHAVEDGRASARFSRLDAAQCTFLVKRTEEALASLSGADAAVLDPPREGCARDVIDGLFGRLRPRTVVYVSCNPVTLARDLRAIVALGYTIRSLTPVDMFPHTPHIETVAVLAR